MDIIQVIGQPNTQFVLNAEKVKFGIKTVLLKPEVMCNLYTIGKIIKLAFQ